MVGRTSETYKSWVRLFAGAERRVRKSISSPSSTKEMQDVGQMSTHASHSIQRLVVKTVCTSQFKQRWASLNPFSRSKPNSTSFLRSLSVNFYLPVERCIEDHQQFYCRMPIREFPFLRNQIDHWMKPLGQIFTLTIQVN